MFFSESSVSDRNECPNCYRGLTPYEEVLGVCTHCRREDDEVVQESEEEDVPTREEVEVGRKRGRPLTKKRENDKLVPGSRSSKAFDCPLCQREQATKQDQHLWGFVYVCRGCSEAMANGFVSVPYHLTMATVLLLRQILHPSTHRYNNVLFVISESAPDERLQIVHGDVYRVEKQKTPNSFLVLREYNKKTYLMAKTAEEETTRLCSSLDAPPYVEGRSTENENVYRWWKRAERQVLNGQDITPFEILLSEKELQTLPEKDPNTMKCARCSAEVDLERLCFSCHRIFCGDCIIASVSGDYLCLHCSSKKTAKDSKRKKEKEEETKSVELSQKRKKKEKEEETKAAEPEPPQKRKNKERGEETKPKEKKRKQEKQEEEDLSLLLDFSFLGTVLKAMPRDGTSIVDARIPQNLPADVYAKVFENSGMETFALDACIAKLEEKVTVHCKGVHKVLG